MREQSQQLAIVGEKAVSQRINDPTERIPSTREATRCDVGAKYAGYFFVLPPGTRFNLTDTINKLVFGTSVDHVICELGPPDDDAAGDGAALFPQVHHSRCLTYVIAKQRKQLVTEGKDRYVDLYFDWKGQLEEIFSEYPPVKSRATDDAHVRQPLPWNRNRDTKSTGALQ